MSDLLTAGVETDAAQSYLFRAPARTKESQGKALKSVLKLAKRIVNQRPEDHLSSILADLREIDISRKDPGKYYEVKDPVKNVAQGILQAEDRQVGDGFYYPTVRNGQYGLDHISPIRYLAQLIRPTTTAVVELGSGWSSNLFQIFIARGATRSKKIIYYGGEYTPEGQICGKYLARIEPKLNYKAFAFDYRNPNIGFFSKQKGHILFFTSHAIEKVGFISPSLFTQLKEIANEITVVHFEPVGWQRVPEIVEKRDNNDDAFFEKLGEKALAGSMDSVVENAAWWSWRLGYNTNLMRIVNALEQEGSIRMRRVEYDFDATANVFNPATLIHYDFVR